VLVVIALHFHPRLAKRQDTEWPDVACARALAIGEPSYNSAAASLKNLQESKNSGEGKTAESDQHAQPVTDDLLREDWLVC
jgi:hypothetical protein